MKDKKNKAAQDMAKIRWSKTTKEQRSEHAHMMLKARRIKRNKHIK